jgi:NADH-quinone oxidoreductase subunit N
MAYSSIAHAGYILLAYVTLRESNLAAVAFYALAYVVMNLGAFFVVIVLEETYGITTVEGCRGIGWRVWPLGAAMTIFLLSLTGIPPTAGFVAKFMLFGSVLKEGGALGTVLVVLGVLFSVVSLGYYARVFGAMYLAKPQGEFRAAAPPWVQTAVLALLAAGVIGLQVAFGPVWAAAEQAGARFLGI